MSSCCSPLSNRVGLSSSEQAGETLLPSHQHAYRSLHVCREEAASRSLHFCHMPHGRRAMKASPRTYFMASNRTFLYTQPDSEK